jgi:hypothetical protein
VGGRAAALRRGRGWAGRRVGVPASRVGMEDDAIGWDENGAREREKIGWLILGG